MNPLESLQMTTPIRNRRWPADQMKCSNCLFFTLADGTRPGETPRADAPVGPPRAPTPAPSSDVVVGVCRRWPPTLVDMPRARTRRGVIGEGRAVSRFPDVFGDEFCGEFDRYWAQGS